MQKLLVAYYAVRHHPVFRLTNTGLVLSRETMLTGIAVPLDPLPTGVEWSDRVRGLKFHSSDAVALRVARGDVCADSLLPRDFAAKSW